MSPYEFQCPAEVTLERVPWATYHCLLKLSHAGPHLISVIGSDALHEALEQPVTRTVGQ
jgi:hypothetical protein